VLKVDLGDYSDEIRGLEYWWKDRERASGHLKI
jgi:hypothetical protein